MNEKGLAFFCRVPGCDKSFLFAEGFEQHWRESHLEQYGWGMFGVYPLLVVCDAEGHKAISFKLFEDKDDCFYKHKLKK